MTMANRELDLVTQVLREEEQIRFRFWVQRGSQIAHLLNLLEFAWDFGLEFLTLCFTDDRLLIVRHDKNSLEPKEVFETYALTSVAIRRYQPRFWFLSPVADIALAGKQQHYVFSPGDRDALNRCFARWSQGERVAS